MPANRAQINFFPVHFDYDSYNLERFDFARGPNSILFGTGSVGGSANGLYKEARTDKAIREVSARVGSWDYYRATFDVNQPINKQLAVRANFLWQDNRTWRDREWQKREAGSLHLTFRPWEKTKIVVVGDKGKVRRRYGTTTIGDRLSSWDGTTVYNGPITTTPAVSTGTQRIGNPPTVSYLYVPGGGATANSVVNWAAMGMTATSHQTGSLYGPSRTPVVGANPGFIPEALHNRVNVPANILGAANAAGFSLPGREFSAAFDDTAYLNDYHHVVASIEQQVGRHLFLQGAVNTSEGLRGSNFGTARGLKDGIQIDINRNLPTSASNPYFLQPYIQTTNDFDQVNTKSDQYRGSAALVFDGTRFGDFRFNIELGHEKLINSREKYRYAVSDPNVDARLWASATLPPGVDGKTKTYSYGGVYHVLPWISVFANYAETWSPPTSNLTIFGQVFGPDVSEGWDAGVRFSVLQGRINASIIRYEGKQSNLTVSTGSNGQNINNIAATNVLNNLSLSGVNARGLQDVPRTYNDTVARKTDGYEFEVVTNVGRGMRLLANLAFANAKQGDALAGTRAYFAQNQNLLKQILSDAGVTVGADNLATVNPGVTLANSPDSAVARDSWNSLYQTLQNTTVAYQKVARLTEATGNLFADYTFQTGRFKNLRLGAGVNYRGREVIGFRGAETIRNPTNASAAIDDPSVDAFTPVYRPSYYLTTAMFAYSRRIYEFPVRFDLRVENVLDEDVPLYYNTVLRPPGGDLSTPARVATPNLFSYITPRNYMLTVSVSF